MKADGCGDEGWRLLHLRSPQAPQIICAKRLHTAPYLHASSVFQCKGEWLLSLSTRKCDRLWAFAFTNRDTVNTLNWHSTYMFLRCAVSCLVNRSCSCIVYFSTWTLHSKPCKSLTKYFQTYFYNISSSYSYVLGTYQLTAGVAEFYSERLILVLHKTRCSIVNISQAIRNPKGHFYCIAFSKLYWGWITMFAVLWSGLVWSGFLFFSTLKPFQCLNSMSSNILLCIFFYFFHLNRQTTEEWHIYNAHTLCTHTSTVNILFVIMYFSCWPTL